MPISGVSTGEDQSLKIGGNGTMAKGVSAHDILLGKDWSFFDGALGLGEFPRFLYNAFHGLWGDTQGLTPGQQARAAEFTAQQVKLAGGNGITQQAAKNEMERLFTAQNKDNFYTYVKNSFSDAGKISNFDTFGDWDIPALTDTGSDLKNNFLIAAVIVAGIVAIQFVRR